MIFKYLLSIILLCISTSVLCTNYEISPTHKILVEGYKITIFVKSDIINIKINKKIKKGFNVLIIDYSSKELKSKIGESDQLELKININDLPKELFLIKIPKPLPLCMWLSRSTQSSPPVTSIPIDTFDPIWPKL